MGNREVTGWEGNQALKLAEKHEVWSHLLHAHPVWTDIEILLNCVRRIIQISHSSFTKDDKIIDEFASVVKTLKAVVVKTFNGRKGEGCVDAEGFTLAYTPFEKVGDVFIGGDFYPHLHFKNGFYQHQIYDHLEKFMRIHGDIVKYSSWVIEAANKDWKRILLSGITLGGKDAGNGDSYHPARQALERFLRMVHPDVVQYQVQGTRVRDVYHCTDCGEEKPPGHSRICTLRKVGQVIRDHRTKRKRT